MTRRFFFYGTLIAGNDNPAARTAHAGLRPLGRATLRGRLVAIADPEGWYPALLDGDDAVFGILYEALPEFGPTDLALLDAFEGTEYERRLVQVHEFGKAEAYWWVAPVPEGAEAVGGGDFAVWLSETGRRAYQS